MKRMYTGPRLDDGMAWAGTTRYGSSGRRDRCLRAATGSARAPERAGGRRWRIVVIGAGLAGLTAARELGAKGHEVIVVDKGRGPGGRMSTRRIDGQRFDHGAQYFTARDPKFRRLVAAWEERGLVQRWRARIAEIGGGAIRAKDGTTVRYVPAPGMSAVCSKIAHALPDCRFRWCVESVDHEADGWKVRSAAGESLEADALVMAAPPEQLQPLVGGFEAERALRQVRMLPCWALMAVFDAALFADYDAAFVNEGPLSWLASQAAKPGGGHAQAWVLHANAEWSAERLEDDPTVVGAAMLSAARELPGARAVRASRAVAHRWRYALAENPLEVEVLDYPESRLAIAGDWCAGSRVEGAFLSGMAAASRITAMR